MVHNASLFFIVLLAFGYVRCIEVDRDLIGWLGETYQPGKDPKQPHMEVLSWEPRIFLFRKLLTVDECDALMNLSRPRLYRSGVSNALTGASEQSDVRTSSGMFFGRGETELIKTIEDRLAKWTMLPADNGEGIQVLHYEKTQKYDPHHDYFSFEAGEDNGGNRMATVLMYLTDVEEGGETVFPKVPAPKSQTSANYSKCAMQGLANKPQQGDAVLFWSIRPDGTFDSKSLHGSCPVIKGEKWSATKWIHVGHYALGGEKAKKITRVYYVPPPPPDVPGCINRHAMCDHWAESGECKENAGYMLGSKGRPGDCLKACNRCDLGPNDLGGAKQPSQASS